MLNVSANGGRRFGRHGRKFSASKRERFGLGRMLLSGGHYRFEEESCGNGEFLLQAEIGLSLERRNADHSVFTDNALHAIAEGEADSELFTDGEFRKSPRVIYFRSSFPTDSLTTDHRSAPWYSSMTSPSAMRAAIFSWQVTQ